MTNSQNENQNQKVDYIVNEDKTVTITSGRFKDVKLLFSNFGSVYDPIENGYLISYDYNIIEGVVEINEGEEIKNLMRTIINDIITGYQNKEE